MQRYVPVKRIPSLDGLRAVSIMLVLIGHIAYAVGFNSWLTEAYSRAGVLVFFVISGYLITTLMLREIAKTNTLNVKQFYLRRMWRIMPVAYCYLAVVTAVQHTQFSWRDIALSWTYLGSYLYYFSHVPWNLGHLWSLSIEEQFYVVWPLIVALGIGRARFSAWACITIAPILRYVLGHHGSGMTALLFSFPGVMDSIATGCLCAIYAPKIGPVRNRWVAFSWLFVIVLPALEKIGNARWLWPIPQLLGHCRLTVFNLAVGVGILWAIAVAPRILNHWLPVWIGTLSYSLYLWQMPCMNPAFRLWIGWRILLSLILASGSYYLIESRFLKLRERFGSSRNFRLVEGIKECRDGG